MSYKDVPDTIMILDEKINTSLDTSLDTSLEKLQTMEEEIKPIIEFSKSQESIQNIALDNDDSNSDSDSDTLEKENAVDITNLSDNGGILYDIMRYFDDLYVTGMTHIENNYFNFSSNEDFNLLYPNIYVGNYSITTNLQLLKGLGITHIISAIPSFNPAFEEHFKYLHIQAYDDDAQDMQMYFASTNEFIKSCLTQNGKVLIHCIAGRSRSITICMAFLISIIKGECHHSIVNYDNELCNLFEYKKLLENNKKQNNHNNQNNQNHNNTYSEKISSNDQELPKLSKKEESFIMYKKQKMISDIDDIISNYNLLKKELDNFNKQTFVETEETQELYDNMKMQFGVKIVNQLIKYVRSYRECASPNNNFIKQLCNTCFSEKNKIIIKN